MENAAPRYEALVLGAAAGDEETCEEERVEGGVDVGGARIILQD